MEILWLCVAVCLHGMAAAIVVDDDHPEYMATGDFPYHVELTDSYLLHWVFNESHIMFEVEVKSNGYFGFGISGNGKMFPADVVVGWVDDNGHPHLIDGHTEAHVAPKQDTHNDWHLISANETGDWTFMRFWRKLDTCDDQDKPILEGTTKVIYSYHPDDPSHHHALDYHGPDRRGTKSLLLLDPPTDELPEGSQPSPSSVTHYDFLNGKFHVPAQDTFYHCKAFTLPDLGGKRHMYRYEPVIQKGHENLVHHMLLYYCTNHVEASMSGASFNCYQSRPAQLQHCNSVMISWAIGGQAFDFPGHVGFSLGTPQDPGFFVMETHYDNPAYRGDFVDDSGIRIFLTSEIRQHDAGLIELGSTVDEHLIIPPRTKEFLSTGYCSADCLGEGLDGKDIHVFSNLLHSHLAGYAIRTRVVRQGRELPPLAQDNNYDFNYQEMRSLPQEYTIKKGDSIIVECLYKTPDRDQTTYGGLSTTDEMCLSFAMYYPRVPLTNCLSAIQYPVQPGVTNTEDFLQTLDWTDQDTHDRFQNVTRESQVYQRCRGTKHFQNHHKFYVQDDLQPKVKYTNDQSTCPKH